VSLPTACRPSLVSTEAKRAATEEAAAKQADVALFFFSGHGVQIDKRMSEIRTVTTLKAKRDEIAQSIRFYDERIKQARHMV
jgi:uncharacterized caspase-like protein